MRLRLKLLALLVAFGIVPVLLVGWAGRDAVRALGRELAGLGRAEVEARITDGVAAAVARAAAAIDQQRRLVELAAVLYARDPVPATAEALRARLGPAVLRLEVLAARDDAPALPLADGVVAWSEPAVDAASGLLSVAAFAGFESGRPLVAIHLAVGEVLSDLQAGLDLGVTPVVLLVTPDPANGGLRVLAGGDGAPGLLPAGQDPPAFAALAAGLAGGGSGLLRLPWRGEPALWGYGSLGVGAEAGSKEAAGVGLVLVVPVRAIQAAAGSAASAVESATLRHLAATGGAVVALVALAFAGAVAGARSVTRPLQALQKAMGRVAAGDFSARAPVRGRDEVAAVAEGFNALVPLLAERLELRQSLDLAQEVQQALHPVAPPEVAGWQVAALSEYCDQTGGDYHDWMPAPGGGAYPVRAAVVVGDVAGHGVAAALLMASARALVRAAAVRAPDPAALLAEVNQALAADVQGGRFVSLFCLFVEPERHVVTWSSAGHPPALLYDPAADRFADLDGDDLPLGIDSGWSFARPRAGTLAPGQLLLIGTDGLWECRNPGGLMFGRERVRTVLRAHHGAGAAAVCDALRAALAAFREGRPAGDDVTVVVLRAG